MSATRDLLEGIAQYLEAQGVGIYDPDAVYELGDTAIRMRKLPATVDRAVALTVYAPQDHPTLNLSQYRVQFWMRGTAGDALDVDDLADDVFHVFHGLEHRDFGTAHVVQALRVSSLPMGEDDNQRHERSDNYLLDINRPATLSQPE
jgi:hypothetical protein